MPIATVGGTSRPRSRASVASAYAARRRSSKPGTPSVNRDPLAPGVRAGSPVKGSVTVGGKNRPRVRAGRGTVKSGPGGMR